MRLRNLALTAACCLIALSLGDRGILNLDTVQAQSAEDPEDYDGILVDAQVEVDKNYYLYVDSYTEVGFDLYDDIDQVEDDWYVDEDDDVFDQDSDQGDDEAGFEASSTAPVASGHEYGVESEGWACYDDGEGDCEWDYVGSAYASVDVASAAPNLTSLSVSGSGGSTVTVGTSGTLTINGTHIVGTQEDNPTIQYGGSGVTFTLAGTPTPTQAQFSYQVSSSAGVGTHNVTLTTHDGTSNGLPLTVGYPPAVITNISPSIWPAGTSFTATITGTNFGTAPTTSISAPGVTAGIATPSNGGSTIAVPITVAANAPNEPVSITVQPSYTGSNFICGTACTGNGSGSTTAEVQALTPTPVIMRVNTPADLANCANGSATSNGTNQTDVFAGELVMLCVKAPPAPYQIINQVWKFDNIADITGGFQDYATDGGQPSATAGGAEAPDPPLQAPSITFYFVNPNQTETATYTWYLNNLENSSATADFLASGPSGNVLPIPHVQTNNSASQILDLQGNANPQANPAQLAMRNAPGNPTVGSWFQDKASSSSGQFIWVQLLHTTNYYQLPRPTIPYTPPSNVTEGLDGIYPYPHAKAVSSGTADSAASDAPARQDLRSNLGEAGEAFDATIYALWDPLLPAGCTPATTNTSTTPYTSTSSTCTSTPIPLGSVRWTWSACAIDNLVAFTTGFTPSWTVQCGPGYAYQPQASSYPEWSECDSSYYADCKH